MVICVYIICEPVLSSPVWRWIASFCCSSSTEHCSKVPRKRAQCQCEWQKLCKYYMVYIDHCNEYNIIAMLYNFAV